MHRPILVSAKLCSPLSGNPPALDALLEFVLSLHHHKAVPGYKIDRKFPAPPQGEIPIPLRREWLGPWFVSRSSNPILAAPIAETVEHVSKKLSVENAGLLAPESRLVVSTTNSWTKSYRLPMQTRIFADEVRWFAVGDRREVLHCLRRVHSIGKKPSIGYGRVASWDVVEAPADYSWYAPTDRGPMLMRTLPVGDWLPAGLVGARADFASCVPPSWHPDRYCEVLVPC